VAPATSSRTTAARSTSWSCEGVTKNHPGRKPPAWLADAQAVAAERIASTRWPEGDTVLMSRAELQQIMRDSIVHGYGMGLRAAALQLTPRRPVRR